MSLRIGLLLAFLAATTLVATIGPVGAQTQREGQTLGAQRPHLDDSGIAKSAPSQYDTNASAPAGANCDQQADDQKLKGKKRKAFLKKCKQGQ